MKQWALLFLRDNASTFEQSERNEKLNEWRKKQGFGQEMSEKDIRVGDFRYAGNPPGTGTSAIFNSMVFYPK